MKWIMFMNEFRWVPPLNNAGLQCQCNVGCFYYFVRWDVVTHRRSVKCWDSASSMVTVNSLCQTGYHPLGLHHSLYFSLFSLSLCPPACIFDMRRAAALQGSKVINVLQMCLWAMKDWGIFPTCCLPASLLFLLLPISTPHLAHPLFCPPSISSPLTCPVFSSPHTPPNFVYSSLLLSFSDPVCFSSPLISSALSSPPLSCPYCGSTGIIKHVSAVLTRHNWHP